MAEEVINKEDLDERERYWIKEKNSFIREGQLNNKEIAEVVSCDPSVVSRINSGNTYKDQNRTYPIRK